MRKTRVRTRQSRRWWIGRPVSVHQTNKLPHAATYGCTTSQGGFATERPASPSLRRLPPALAPLCAKFSLSAAAAAASSERQTIRQTPALPCLPGPHGKSLARKILTAPASVCAPRVRAERDGRYVCMQSHTRGAARTRTHPLTPRSHLCSIFIAPLFALEISRGEIKRRQHAPCCWYTVFLSFGKLFKC